MIDINQRDAKTQVTSRMRSYAAEQRYVILLVSPA